MNPSQRWLGVFYLKLILKLIKLTYRRRIVGSNTGKGARSRAGRECLKGHGCTNRKFVKKDYGGATATPASDGRGFFCR
ncbi:hypothetical protein BV504_03655 [Halomonas sp. 'Soap Lake |nr:hypothetical protein B2G49_03645 [Halomonas sp. 'Soap Lake \